MPNEEGKRYFDNPYPDFSPSDPYLDSATVPDDDGTLRLCVNSNLGIKILNATDRLLHIIENAYSSENTVKDYSTYTGLSGILYLYHALGKEVDESMILACLESKSLKKRLGYLGGISGPLAYAAAYSKTHKKEYLKTLMGLKDSQLFKDSPEEFLYGKAGYLYALLFVKNANPSFTELDDVIRSVISILLRIGSSASSTLSYEWHEKEYLGAAHGYAGILSTLLRAKTYLSPLQIDLIHSKVDELMRLQFPSGNFPSSISSSTGDKLVHWCHGAPGFADLYLLSFEVFKDQKYFQVAERCLDDIWNRGLLKKGFGLCHGSSGNGYTFLLAYKNTKNLKYFYRALRFAEWCCDFDNSKCQTPDRPFSLFEGLAGNLFFLHHIQNSVDKAYFPCYSF